MTTRASRSASRDRREASKQTRREALIKAAAATLAATGLGTPGVLFGMNIPSAVDYTQTPGMTQGPYWLDSMPNRSDIRSDSSGGTGTQSGFPFYLGVNVSRLASGIVTPVAGARVDVWHCSAYGVYSGFATEGTSGRNFLRGYQVTNSHGNARFSSIYPGWYSGRTVHIHFRVRLYSGTTVTYNFVSQFFSTTAIDNVVYATVPYNTRSGRTTYNSNDGLYLGSSQGNGGSVSSNVGAYLLLRLGKNSSSAIASFNVVL